ncbi:MAG TPA: hypothetical protein IAC02_02465 [Candidatus Coprovivens excrementavium]|nr:hypothetical protein [Candidatus Coprovivens excrementavium]
MNNKHVDDIIEEEVNKETQLMYNYFKDQIEDKNAVIMIQSVSIMILIFLLIFMSIV